MIQVGRLQRQVIDDEGVLLAFSSYFHVLLVILVCTLMVE